MRRLIHSFVLAFAFVCAAFAHSTPSAAQSRWVQVASAKVDPTMTDLAIAIPDGIKARAIRLQARDGNVRINAIVVRYGAGRVELEERPINLLAGERTRPVDLAGAGQVLVAVDIVVQPKSASGPATEAVTLEVWALTDAAPERIASVRTESNEREVTSSPARPRQISAPAPTASKPTRSLPADEKSAGSGEKSMSDSPVAALDACVADKSCTAVPVFFGTDRKPTQVRQRVSFGPDRSGRVQLGRVFVTVPRNNRQTGQLNVPGSWSWLRGVPEGGDPRRHFTIPASGVTLFDTEADFIAAVRDHVGSGNGTHKDHAFVYVHGYRVPWEFAAMRTAQIAYDLSPNDAPFGTPFLYSWPSQGAADAYITDLENSRIAIPHLKSFLEMVVSKTGASNVHVIAHSMGNYPVMHALSEISKSTPNVKFSQVILAAPDVEKGEFEDIAANVVKVAQGVTLYASSSDIALLVSRLVRKDKARAGDAKDPPGPTVVAGIDTVDISRLSTGFMSYFSWNHDKYADSPVLLNDISHLFRKGERPPNNRDIRFRPQPSQAVQARFWRYEE